MRIALFIEKLLPKFIGMPGAVDLHIQQPYDYPQINVDVDRSKATFLGLTQQNVASNMLISLSGSFQTSPSFWIDPKSGTQYNVVAQTPQYQHELAQRSEQHAAVPYRRLGARRPRAPRRYSPTCRPCTAASRRPW